MITGCLVVTGANHFRRRRGVITGRRRKRNICQHQKCVSHLSIVSEDISKIDTNHYARQQSRVQSFIIKILQINAATNLEAKFQIFSKIHGVHKEFMIAPRLSEMHRALGEASAPNKRISGKQEKFGEVDFATSRCSSL